jgi:hypothetical protein
MENKIYIRNFTTNPDIAEAIRRVRKYFTVLTRFYSNIQDENKRRTDNDYAYYAIAATKKLEGVFNLKNAYIGSVHLSKTRWATLGNNQKAQNKFKSFVDIVDYYETKIFKKNNTIQLPVHFNSGTMHLLNQLSKDHGMSIDTAFALSFLVTQDLIFHCGPDNKFFFHLFTNSLVEQYGDINFEDWARMRCQVWGRWGIVDKFNEQKSEVLKEDYRNSYISSLVGSEDILSDEENEYFKWYNLTARQQRKQYIHSTEIIKVENSCDGIEYINFEKVI